MPNVVYIEQEPDCCCCASNIGLRIWASIVVVLNIVSVALQLGVNTTTVTLSALSIISALIVILAYGYLFYAVTARSPAHLQRCSIVLGLLVVLSIILAIVSVVATDWQAYADLLNKDSPTDANKVTAEMLRSSAWVFIGISVSFQVIFAGLFIGCIQQYKKWLIKMTSLGSNPDVSV